VEYDHFPNSGSGNLIGTQRERAQMQITDRAAREAPELQMDQPVRVGKPHRFPVHVSQGPRRHHIAGDISVREGRLRSSGAQVG
jgi:hypothetical protein